MARPPYRSELIGADPIFLLEIDFGGIVYRFSSEVTEISAGGGDLYQYDGGLDETTWIDAMDLFQPEAELRSASFALVFPDDVAERIARGHDLSSAVGELSMWVGGTYEDRKVLVRGQLDQPLWGEYGEPVSFTLAELPWDDQAIIPDPAAVVDEVTWPAALGVVNGAGYPIVFGQPGDWSNATGSDMRVGGSPGLAVVTSGGITSLILIAGHTVDTAAVDVYSGNNDDWADNLAITHQDDGLGRRVAVVDISGQSSSFKTGGDFWCEWEEPALIDPATGQGLSGAGALLQYLMTQMSVRVDAGRIRAAVRYLDRFRVSGYIQEATSPFAWIQQHLLPILPVSILSSDRGLYPVVWRWDAVPADAIDHIEVGAGISRRGGCGYVQKRSEVVNDITLEYAYQPITGAHARRDRISATPDSPGRTQITNLCAKQSASRYGVRAEVLQTQVVYDTDTAHLILEWMSLARGFLHRTVTYDVGMAYGHLEPGDVVALTDSGLHLDAQIALVQGVEWGGPSLGLTLLIIEDPARDLGG